MFVAEPPVTWLMENTVLKSQSFSAEEKSQHEQTTEAESLKPSVRKGLCFL